MQKILVDAGPLIALFNRSDSWHEKAVSYFKTLKETPLTTWPVITEVSYMLNFSVMAQTDFLTWVNYGAISIIQQDKFDLDRFIDLMRTYENVPMDLADASLIVASEELKTTRIISIDSDFQIFRNRFKGMLVNEFG